MKPLSDEVKKDLDLVHYIQGWAISRIAILRARDIRLPDRDLVKVKRTIEILRDPG